MGNKLYQIFMIVLPIFVGSGGIIELIHRFSTDNSNVNPWICLVLIIAGFAVGIRNILNIINKNERENN